MCQVKVSEGENGKILVSTPYNPDLPARAKKLGGQWIALAKAWCFDGRLEADVAALYRGIYGEWPGEAVETVTVRAECPDGDRAEQTGIFVLGRCLARARGRDSGAVQGEGVVVRSGGFRSGGSMKYWTTVAEEGTVVDIFDVPRNLVEGKTSEGKWTVKVVEGSAAIDREALEAEKARLLARIAEIDALLGQ